MLKKAIGLMVGAILALSLPAFAGEIYFNAAGAESTSSSGTTCSVAVNDPAIADAHTYVTRNCANGGGAFVWHFNYPADAPVTGTPFKFELTQLGDGSTGGLTSFKGQIACTKSTAEVNYHTLPFPADATCTASGTPYACCTGSGVGNCEASVICSVATDSTTICKTSLSGAFTPSEMASDETCAIRITRSTTDAFGGTVKVVTGRINY